jgi:Flp pilus assembly protein TadG
MRTFRKPWKASAATRGQAVVETALLLPILLLLLIGIAEFGFILYAHVQVSNAAREAARAASLYRSTRFSTIDPSQADTTKCDGSIVGWSLDQVVKQAIVYRELATSGCPKMTSTTVNYTSLGWLDPLPSTMWTVTIKNTTFIPQTNATANPTAGSRATVELKYPYRLLVLSNLIPYFSDPIWITKSVDFKFHQ